MGYAGLHKRQILPEECDGAARELFRFFNARPMLEFLEGLTTIPALIPDPYFVGGGYHETGQGGKLGIHADFRINDRLHLHRRINVIILSQRELGRRLGWPARALGPGDDRAPARGRADLQPVRRLQTPMPIRSTAIPNRCRRRPA